MTASDVTFLDGPSDGAKSGGNNSKEEVVELDEENQLDLSEIPFLRIKIEKKMAKRSKDIPERFDYKDVKMLQRFIDPYGQIEPISKTGLSAKQQRSLAGGD